MKEWNDDSLKNQKEQLAVDQPQKPVVDKGAKQVKKTVSDPVYSVEEKGIVENIKKIIDLKELQGITGIEDSMDEGRVSYLMNQVVLEAVYGGIGLLRIEQIFTQESKGLLLEDLRKQLTQVAAELYKNDPSLPKLQNESRKTPAMQAADKRDRLIARATSEPNLGSQVVNALIDLQSDTSSHFSNLLETINALMLTRQYKRLDLLSKERRHLEAKETIKSLQHLKELLSKAAEYADPVPAKLEDKIRIQIQKMTKNSTVLNELRRLDSKGSVSQLDPLSAALKAKESQIRIAEAKSKANQASATSSSSPSPSKIVEPSPTVAKKLESTGSPEVKVDAKPSEAVVSQKRWSKSPPPALPHTAEVVPTIAKDKEDESLQEAVVRRAKEATDEINSLKGRIAEISNQIGGLRSDQVESAMLEKELMQARIDVLEGKFQLEEGAAPVESKLDGVMEEVAEGAVEAQELQSAGSPPAPPKEQGPDLPSMTGGVFPKGSGSDALMRIKKTLEDFKEGPMVVSALLYDSKGAVNNRSKGDLIYDLEILRASPEYKTLSASDQQMTQVLSQVCNKAFSTKPQDKAFLREVSGAITAAKAAIIKEVKGSGAIASEAPPKQDLEAKATKVGEQVASEEAKVSDVTPSLEAGPPPLPPDRPQQKEAFEKQAIADVATVVPTIAKDKEDESKQEEGKKEVTRVSHLNKELEQGVNGFLRDFYPNNEPGKNFFSKFESTFGQLRENIDKAKLGFSQQDVKDTFDRLRTFAGELYKINNNSELTVFAKAEAIEKLIQATPTYYVDAANASGYANKLADTFKDQSIAFNNLQGLTLGASAIKFSQWLPKYPLILREYGKLGSHSELKALAKGLLKKFEHATNAFNEEVRANELKGALGAEGSLLYHLRFGYRSVSKDMEPSQYMAYLKVCEPELYALNQRQAEAKGARVNTSEGRKAEWRGVLRTLLSERNWGPILVFVGTGLGVIVQEIKGLGKLITNPSGYFQERREVALRRAILDASLELQNRADNQELGKKYIQGAAGLGVELTRPVYDQIQADLEKVGAKGADFNELRQKYSGTPRQVVDTLVKQYSVKREAQVLGTEKASLLALDPTVAGRVELFKDYHRRAEKFSKENPQLAAGLALDPKDGDNIPPPPLPPDRVNPTNASARAVGTEAVSEIKNQRDSAAAPEAKVPESKDVGARPISVKPTIAVIVIVDRGRQLASLKTQLSAAGFLGDKKNAAVIIKNFPVSGRASVTFNCPKDQVAKVASALVQVNPPLATTDIDKNKKVSDFRAQFEKAIVSNRTLNSAASEGNDPKPR